MRARKPEPRFCSQQCWGDFRTGGNPGYITLHERVYRKRGKAHGCSRCGNTDPDVRYEWASLTGKLDDIWDYESMCRSCHQIFDGHTGSGHCRAKLTEQIVLDCSRRYLAGENAAALAREFGVSRNAMWKAVTGRSWQGF